MGIGFLSAAGFEPEGMPDFFETMGRKTGLSGYRVPEFLQTHPVTKAIFLILGCMAYEGSPNDWASTHIKHHAHSDQEGDPHSPLEGFWHAHFGWLFSRKNFPDVEEYAPHLLEDPVIQFVNRFTPLRMILSLVIPGLINILYATGACKMPVFGQQTPTRYLLLFQDGPANRHAVCWPLDCGVNVCKGFQ